MPLVFPLTFNGNVGFPIKQTPRFNTIIQNTTSGRGGTRIPTQAFPLWDFVLDISFLSGDAQGTYNGAVIAGGTQYQKLVNFFMSVQGSGSDWLFQHPYDDSVGTYTIAGSLTSKVFVINENIIQSTTLCNSNFISLSGATFTVSGYSGIPDTSHTWVGQTSGAVWTPSAAPVLVTSMPFQTGDGTTVAFSLLRTILSGGAQDLMQNFVTAPLIYDNGSLVSAANYSIDQYGTITFTVAPLNTHILSWAGQFYYRCFFLEDFWDAFEESYYQIWTLSGLKFRSVLQ
jgi:hypothetical protein